ncbi:MAG TPA: maltotransferase domain-containing protein [Gemmatimonadales bacterium]|nr:maltotransferase domain-containing protein [Gemmatimonadales bacterium]
MPAAKKPATAGSAPPRHPPRVVVEHVQPVVDGGRYAAKCVVGTPVTVEALAYKEGHDLLAGRLRYRAPGDGRWHAVPMTYDVNFDRLRGAFTPDAVGRWDFTVDAWTDRYGSWCADLAKRVHVGQDVAAELPIGAALIARAMRAARGAARSALRRAEDAVRDATLTSDARAARALDEELLALVRAHLPPDDRSAAPATYPLDVDRPTAACAAWYEMFPRSQGTVPGRHGTFAEAARRLPRLAELGFDVIYLPPIHPIGVSHRKARNNALTAAPGDPGSPWAIGSADGGHTAVEPALGTLDDFDAFVAHADALGLEVALDYALQCSPDHPWVTAHPDWFFVRPDGTIRYAENPPKKYEDIVPLNFWCADRDALWEACRDIFLFWIGRGVRTFRVDNPHTKPFAFWEWVLREVRRREPDVVFLAEAFTRPARMQGLARLGFTQSYTYFTWRNTAAELTAYLTDLTRPEMVRYFRPNFFANTPDILHEYLQQGGRPAFRARLLLAGTLSPLYGIYSGFEVCENVPREPGSEEYLHSEKYEIRVRDYEAPGNLNDDIARLNRLRREHPALRRLDNLTFCRSENDQILWYHKAAPGDDLLIAVNLDPHHAQETMVHVPLEPLGLAEDAAYSVYDLWADARYDWRGRRNFVRLDPRTTPGHVFSLHAPGDVP